MQRERKERITKKEFYELGGFANRDLFRKQSRGGAWRYYRFEFDQGAMLAHFVRIEDGARSAEIAGDEAWKLYNLDRYARREELNAAADAMEWGE